MSKNPHGDVMFTSVDRVNLPVPSAGIFDDPVVYKRVNRQWLSHIAGVIEGLAEFSAWSGLPEDIKRAIDEIHLFLVTDANMIENCEQVMNCVSANDTIIQLVNDSNNNLLRSATNQWTTNVNQWTNIYNQNISEYLPTLPVKKFLPNSPTADESSILCDVLGIWLDSWQIRALQLIEVLQGLVNFGSGISSAISILAGSHPDRVSQFILTTFSGFAGAQFNGTAGELSDLKDAYESPSAMADVKCALIQAFAYRAIGFSSYLRRMAELPALTTTIDGTLIANHMLDVLADPNLPEYAQPAYLYLVELFDCVLDTNDPIGSCGSCIPALPCGVTPLRINVNTGSSSALPPPDFAGSDAIWAQSPVSVWYIGLRDNVNSWYEHRVGYPANTEICFYRIAGIWRANSASLTGAFLDVYADNVLVDSFALPSPLTTTFQSFNFLLSETIICNSVRIKIRGGNSASNYTLLRNIEIWRYT